MRKIITLFSFVLPIMALCQNSQIHSREYITLSEKTDSLNVEENFTEERNAQIVYICTGSYAYAYHSRSDCSGLSNCKGDINYLDENSAINYYGRSPCCKCWSNVGGRCKDDNPTYGGGGGGDNSDALAALGIIMIAASAAILSNDLYYYPVLSFYSPFNSQSQLANNIKIKNNSGSAFGFRKTFDHSALEYGVSYLKTGYEYNYGWGYTTTREISRWGVHLNYVQHFFYDKTPHWLKLYCGPSLNYVYDFGFGGILGAEIKLLDRLRFDTRYELTNQTNQIQAGLIFTYQKEYFWRK